MGCRLPAEQLRRDPDSERARDSLTERLPLLLKLVNLLGHDLDELLKLLQLRGNELKQLLKLEELLLLERLNVLKLLHDDLQQRQNRLRGSPVPRRLNRKWLEVRLSARTPRCTVTRPTLAKSLDS